LKEPAAAADAAQQLPRFAPDDPDQYSLAAWNLALCAALVSQDPNRPEAEREARKQGYARQAVELLRAAVERGFQNREELKSADYDVLRGRDDFQELLRRLEERLMLSRSRTTEKG
jgi:hypothetical protein